MRKGVVFLLSIIIIAVCFSSVFAVKPITLNVENLNLNQEEISISPKVRLMAKYYGGYLHLYERIRGKGFTGQEALNYISYGLGDAVKARGDKGRIEPENAEVMFTGDYDAPFLYKGEKCGIQIDMEKLYADIARSIDDKSEVIESKIIINADITLEELKKCTAKRSEFHTDYATSSNSRKHNIELAARYLNGAIIPPEGMLSFNTIVGPRTEDRGFMKANIIYRGEMVLGTGGGVCQVSSTLYNSCLLSGINIVKSTRHSRPIPYLPPSRDAMVSNTSDLIGINPTAYPMYVVTKTTGKTIYIAIYGERQEFCCKISEQIISKIPPFPDKITVKGDMPDELRRILSSNNDPRLANIAYRETLVSESREGLISEAYLEIYKDNQLIEKRLISHDLYPAKQGEIIRELM